MATSTSPLILVFHGLNKRMQDYDFGSESPHLLMAPNLPRLLIVATFILLLLILLTPLLPPSLLVYLLVLKHLVQPLSHSVSLQMKLRRVNMVPHQTPLTLPSQILLAQQEAPLIRALSQASPMVRAIPTMSGVLMVQEILQSVIIL